MRFRNTQFKFSKSWFERVATSLLALCLFSHLSDADALPVGEVSADIPLSENWSIHGQGTVVSQGDGARAVPYSGQNSLRSDGEIQNSLTTTLFLGRKLWGGGEIYFNPEVSAGSGLSKTTGLAGFSNGEIYRVDNPNPQFNPARLYYQHVIGFGDGKEYIEGDKNQLAKNVDRRRLTIIAGKFALNDFFDNNSYGHDPRSQFLNWALMDHGAWDYAADTRGYSWGLYLEYNQPRWAVRVASVLEPQQANQMAMDTHIAQAHGDNAEFEYRYSLGRHPGTVRVLGYMNHAHMGNYQQAIQESVDAGAAPDVTQTRSYCIKYGAGLGLEQELAPNLGIFARASWNDGQAETWAFTEIDRSLSLGVSLSGAAWGRVGDTAGAALIVNGLSRDHADYLSSGGYGFIIGDGQLNYAPEQIAELYYQYRPFKMVALAADFQAVNNPAYNQDRGPVAIFATRMHVEF